MKKLMYYIIQWTWGLPMNILGLLAFCVLTSIGCPCHRYRKAICIVFPKKFGAISLGMFMIRSAGHPESCSHEYGHSIQNMKWGWLFPFVIGLPSLIRSQARNFYYSWIYGKTRKSLKPYDSIWFEGEATDLGKKANENTWDWI